MQWFGHIKIGNEKILVLVRHGLKMDKYCYSIKLKLREYGDDGSFMEDESEYLSEYPEALGRLKSGEVIEC